jgi:hypothetical protein
VKCEVPLSFFDYFVPRGEVVVAKGRELPYVAGTSAPDGFYTKLLVEVVQCAAFGASGAFGSDVRSEIYNQNLLAASTGAPLVK